MLYRVSEKRRKLRREIDLVHGRGFGGKELDVREGMRKEMS